MTVDEPKLNTPNGEVRLADFDLDAWIDGTTGITGMARIVQRGDLLAARDRLVAELNVARKIPNEDRGVGDRAPQTVESELEQVYAQIWDSILWVHIQDRTEDRRAKLREQLKDDGVDEDDLPYHVLADSIVKIETSDGKVVPLGEEGFGGERILAIRKKGGDAALHDAIRVFGEVTASAPAVRAPLSREPSSTRSGGTSRSGSKQRSSGASRRS